MPKLRVLRKFMLRGRRAEVLIHVKRGWDEQQIWQARPEMCLFAKTVHGMWFRVRALPHTTKIQTDSKSLLPQH